MLHRRPRIRHSEVQRAVRWPVVDGDRPGVLPFTNAGLVAPDMVGRSGDRKFRVRVCDPSGGSDQRRAASGALGARRSHEA